VQFLDKFKTGHDQEGVERAESRRPVQGRSIKGKKKNKAEIRGLVYSVNNPREQDVTTMWSHDGKADGLL